MGAISLGDLAQSTILRRHSAWLKSDLQRLSTELTTGQVTDIAAHVSGDLVPISGIDASLARLTSYGAVTSEAALFASSMQTALQTIDGLASDLGQSLLSATTGAATARLQDVAGIARQSLGTALTALNSRVGDRAIFSGTKTNVTPLVDADTFLAALERVTAGATSPAQADAAITAWFDDPQGYSTLAYQGGAALADFSVAAGEEARLDITANDPTVKGTLKGLAMAALLDRGLFQDQTAAQLEFAARAGSNLLQNQVDRTGLAARLGGAEVQIEAASARNSAESAGLQIARNAITAADPYETASRLQETEGQLELLYTITARLARLSLVDYL